MDYEGIQKRLGVLITYCGIGRYLFFEFKRGRSDYGKK